MKPTKSILAINQAVAIVIRTAQQAIEKLELTDDELVRYLEYLRHQEAIGPLLDPSAWLGDTFDRVDQVKARTQLVRQLAALTVHGEGGLIGALLAPMYSAEADLEIKAYIVAPLPEDKDEAVSQ
jgi:hypothetical protein